MIAFRFFRIRQTEILDGNLDLGFFAVRRLCRKENFAAAPPRLRNFGRNEVCRISPYRNCLHRSGNPFHAMAQGPKRHTGQGSDDDRLLTFFAFFLCPK